MLLHMPSWKRVKTVIKKIKTVIVQLCTRQWILQHFLILSHSWRTLIIRWKCQTLHTICNQTDLFKMETYCVSDGTKLKCAHLNYRGAIVSHVYLEEVLRFLSEEKVEKIRCCSVLQKQMKRCNREPTFQCQNYMQSNMHVQSKQAHKKTKCRYYDFRATWTLQSKSPQHQDFNTECFTVYRKKLC